MAYIRYQKRTKERPIGSTGMTWWVNISTSFPSLSIRFRNGGTFNTRTGFSKNLGGGFSVRNI